MLHRISEKRTFGEVDVAIDSGVAMQERDAVPKKRTIPYGRVYIDSGPTHFRRLLSVVATFDCVPGNIGRLVPVLYVRPRFFSICVSGPVLAVFFSSNCFSQLLRTCAATLVFDSIVSFASGTNRATFPSQSITDQQVERVLPFR